MNKTVFINERIIEVPEELYPLEGSVTVPVVLSPAQFDKFWRGMKSEPEDDNVHAVITTYKTRVPLIVNTHLKFAGEAVELSADPMDLPDQAIAPFVIAATQECVNRASRLPTLPRPSKNGTTA